MVDGADHDEGSLLALGLLALVAGAAAGLVGAVFRLSLEQADRLRNALIGWAHGEEAAGFLLVVAACASATAIAGWLVRRFSPYAAGSGIPHVEAVLREELPPIPFRLIPVKFLGGLLAIGSGLALGREGPTVQMGASLAHLVGKLFARTWADCRVLIAAGAGAGLGTAFNAPIAGAVFVLEELVQRFEHRIAIAALGASATAIGVARLLVGDMPDFTVSGLGYGDAETRALYFVFGAFAGILAVAYNRLLLATRAATRRLIFARLDSARRPGRRGRRRPRLVRERSDRRRRRDHPERPDRERAARRHSRRLPDPICARPRVVRCGNSGRSVRPHAGLGGAVRIPDAEPPAGQPRPI